uniref:Tyrosine kinase with immunoglobulin-like and EGF-like domains 1 n=1 Tax=Amphilophus citrinellus TaxID=61819 RepID=A0A3Q0RWE2_AMPCI
MFCAGNYYYMTHWNDVINQTAVLIVENARTDNRGIYSASYVGDSPLKGAWMRLIVRGCPSQKWGPNCIRDCQQCLNGGVCHEVDGDCICPPGFMGTRCETACREGMFGQNCQEACGSELNCKGLRFCLPDPYGCSCASGWFGSHCERGTVHLFNKTHCLFFFSGVSITCSNHIGSQTMKFWFLLFCCQPAIMTCMDQTASLAANARMEESAAVSVDASVLEGGEDSTVRSLVGIFRVGLILRVSLPCGSDMYLFFLSISVNQLLVMPVHAYIGDGPIVSTRVLYKPQKNEKKDLWSSIIGMREKTNM